MPTPIPNIWQLQSHGEIDALIEALRHREASVRKGAAAALRALGAWQAVPALEAALAVESDWQAHAAISAALQYLDRDIHIETMLKNKDVRGLSKMLSSPKPEDILQACTMLGALGDRQAVESLVTVFRNPLLPNNVRLAAAEALLKLESAPAVVTLLGALRRDDWQVRRNAAAVLGQLQATWAAEPLIKLLNDPNQSVRRTAAAALHRISTPEAIRAAKSFDEAQARESKAVQTAALPAASLLPDTLASVQTSSGNEKTDGVSQATTPETSAPVEPVQPPQEAVVVPEHAPEDAPSVTELVPRTDLTEEAHEEIHYTFPPLNLRDYKPLNPESRLARWRATQQMKTVEPETGLRPESMEPTSDTERPTEAADQGPGEPV